MAVLDGTDQATLQAREEFLSGLPPRETVRSDILASWRRSLFSGAAPDLAELPYDDHIDEESRLQRSAWPVLDDLAGQLYGSTAALLLADDDARIIGRWAGSDEMSRVMDSTCSAPGFSLEETTCGTNGLGSVLEERRLFHVTGAEHYANRFLGYSCCGAPVHDPVSGQLHGVITLVCPGEDANGLMAPIVLQAVSAIQQRLLEEAGHDERQLLAMFLSRQHDTRRPLVAINERAVISTPAAARAFDPYQLAVLWEHVAGVVASRKSEQVELWAADNRSVLCDCSPLVEHGVVHGALVEIGPAAGHRSLPVNSSALPSTSNMAGSSRGWQQTLREAARLAPSPLPLLVSGPAGSGKLELVKVMHDRAVASGRLSVVDAAMSALESENNWLRRLVNTVEGDDEVVVVRHIDQMESRMANVLGAVLDQRPAHRAPRMVATMTTDGDIGPPATSGLLDRFVHRLEVSSLRERKDDIPDLVAALVERYRPGSGRRFSSETLQALMRVEWTGNIRQLETVVLCALERHSVGDITRADLPEHLVTSSSSPLTPMQQAELKAISTALRKSEGNKQEAAAALGIARSTLYKKLREFGLDLDRTTY